MPVCSYLVITESTTVDSVGSRLASHPSCQVTPARNRSALLLVTETDGPEEDREVREWVEETEGVVALVLTFGEIQPDPSHQAHRPLPVVGDHRRPAAGRPGLP